MTPCLTLHLDGPFRGALPDGTPLAPLSQRAQVLLAYLTGRSGMRASREELAALIWGERAEEQARASLRQELSLLRKALPQGALDSDRLAVWLVAGAVRLAPPEGGAPLLEGLTLNSEPVQDWLRAARAADSAQRIEQLLAQGAAALAQGDAERAATAAQHAAQMDALYEPAVRLAMQAEAARGNRTAALALYTRFADTLQDSLGVDPDAETRALAADLRASDGTAPTTAKPDARAAPTLAVLAFDDLSPQAGDMFADGVVEEITGALSRVHDFHVIARQSAFALRGEALDIPAIAARLNADYIVEGSVRRSNDRVRITVQLASGADGRTLWSERFDDRLDDLFDLQDRIAARVAGQISPSLRSAEIARARTTPPADRTAYELVLTALPHFWVHRETDNRRALDLLEQATRRAPDYALALALKAWCTAQQATYHWSTAPRDDLAEARCLAHLAAIHAGDHAPTLTAIGAALSLSDGNTAQASDFIDRALVLDPNNAWAWMRRGWMANFNRDADAALAAFDRAEALSPLDPFMFNILLGRASTLYRVTDRYDEALVLMRQALGLNPGVTWVWRMLAACHFMMGDTEAAHHAVRMFLHHHPQVTIRYLREALPPAAVISGASYYQLLARAGIPEE